MSEFFKWLIIGWSIVVVGVTGVGLILFFKFENPKKIELDDITLCFIIAFICWLIPIMAFWVMAQSIGF